MILKSFLTMSLCNTFHTGIYSTVRCKSGVVESIIRSKLKAALETTHLDVINESTTHDGDAPKVAESHFKLVVVTDKFHGLPMYKRYNLINDILKEELQAGTHRFSIVAKTSIQWYRSQAAKGLPLSPDSGGALDK